MRNKLAKKIRKSTMKYAKRNWIEYVQAIAEWPFPARWRFAWQIIFHAKKWRKPANER